MVNIILKKTLPVQIWKFFNPEIFADLGVGSVRKTETSRVDGAFCGLFSASKSTIKIETAMLNTVYDHH